MGLRLSVPPFLSRPAHRTRDLSRRAADGIRSAALARPRLTRAALLAAVPVAWLSIGAVAWFTYDVTHTLPGRKEVRSMGNMAQATVLYDVADRPVFTIFKEQRIEVPLERISPNLINAVLSVEDQRFYSHRGVDIIRTMGAVLVNLQSGRYAQGGSTVTQQLARQSFLTLERSLSRKIKEWITAALIERTYSKQEILELYLNKVYFGDGFHGVEAAARGYFAKSAAELTVEEAALIAGIIKSPSTWAPTVNLDKAVSRRNIVLATMLENQKIDRATFDRARQAPVRLQNGLQRDESFGQYFKEQVRRELVDRFGWGRVASGGLRVYTTIDPAMQQAAERALEAGLTTIEKRSRYKHQTRAQFLAEVGGVVKEGVRPPYLQGGVMAMDPRTGEVRVMVGGRTFTESRFNRAVQARRQPGSAFKPFVYAAALESGMTPASLLTGLDEPVDTPQGGWVPEDEHLEASAMTIRTALRTSSNRAAVRAFQTVGLEKEMIAIDRLQFGDIPHVPSIALGSGEVTLQQMTAAFATFANGGQLPKPMLVRRVEDGDGEVIFEAAPQLTQAFTPTTAFLMASMLTDVINAGTAYRARAEGFVLPAAGKTGTTNDYVDAWFVGFTPTLVAGVWVGFDQPQTITSAGYAGDLAVPLWADFMKEATKGNKPVWLKPPANVVAVTICRMSGRRPGENCDEVEVVSKTGETKVRSMVMTEYFVKGTEPYDECPLHTGVGLLTRLGGLFGGGSSPQPVSAAASPLPEHAVDPPAASGTAVPPPSPERDADGEEPKKKRGFWGRIFGSRKNAPAAERPDDDRPDDPR
ncbi:MAG: PBP1A family penicillin-binding protein [Vicinamibacteraceae bacterium]